ncbi:MAG: type II toxin-antitoxin system RelE/ParE family toxin [Nitrospirae bacterium]|nr:type II toxin-antitoxin system RelE/ParE family toxin [Nitrospirota bacterium]
MEPINVSFHPDAMQEYIASYVWYFEKGAHLAHSFEQEIERVIRLIVESPERWPIYEIKYRKILVRRFPYSVIYEIRDTSLVVMAVAHGHRKPGYWKNRINR